MALGLGQVLGGGEWGLEGVWPVAGACNDCRLWLPHPSFFPLPSLRGSSTQLSPESISVTSPLWG